MDEQERATILEQLDHWQATIEQLHWDCARQIEDAKCLIDSDFPYYINLPRLRSQIQHLVMKCVKDLSSEHHH